MQVSAERLYNHRQAKEGWVYVVTNKSLPGLVKVGYTTQPDVNGEIDQAGLPYPHEVAYQAWVSTPQEVEQSVHQVLDTWQENGGWFRCSAARAQYAIELLNPNHAEPSPPSGKLNNDSDSTWPGYSEEPNAPRPRGSFYGELYRTWAGKSLLALISLALLCLVHIGLAVGFPSTRAEPLAYNVCLKDGDLVFGGGGICSRGRHLGQIRQTTASQRRLYQTKNWVLDFHLRHFLRTDASHRGFDSSRQARRFVKRKHMVQGR